jgi:hypothetical protein
MSIQSTPERERQGRLVLEASTGTHGPVAQELARMWCEAIADRPSPIDPTSDLGRIVAACQVGRYPEAHAILSRYV